MNGLAKIVRDCGGCTACCKTHIDIDMKLNGGEYCDCCIIGTGCSVYEIRPYPCRVYRCLWVCGKGEEGDRPDRLGVVMDMTVTEFRGEEITAINFWEVIEGSINDSRVEQIMVAYIKAGKVAVYWPYRDDPIFYFPKGKYTEDEQYLCGQVIENDPGAG